MSIQHVRPERPPAFPHLSGRRLVGVTTLPVEPKAYHAFYQTPTGRWWKSLLALLLAAIVWFVVQIVFGLPGIMADMQLGYNPTADPPRIGPWTFLSNNVAIALALPIAMLTQWFLMGQRPKWLSSVAGGIRWGWLARCFAVLAPIWLVMVAVEYVLAPPQDVQLRWYTGLMIGGILLTTPFQAAGEEYLCRGLLARAVAAWIKPEIIGFVVSTIVNAGVFMLLHGAGDPWLNVYYFAFGAAASWMTWRTGGLEAAIALHVVNNLLSEALMPFTDFSGMMDRSAGAADATVLINVAVMLAAAALITWLAGRRGVTVRTAPGRDILEAERAQLMSNPYGYPGYAPQQAYPYPQAGHTYPAGGYQPMDDAGRAHPDGQFPPGPNHPNG